MDERQRAKVKARLEFYEELGIEEFYIRRTKIAKAAPLRQPDLRDNAGTRTLFTEKRSESRPQPINASFGSPAASQHQLGVAPQAAAAPGPVARPMGLFESASTTAPREDETLEEIRADLGDCRRCRLAAGRHTIVFGQGNPHAELVFVGEGPGADEDAQGLPFVGRAGRLLNRMIELAGMNREDVYICNIVKCRPPENRVPQFDEISSCLPYLWRQIELVRPKVILAMGGTAAQSLLDAKQALGAMRNRVHRFRGIPVVVTYHPAALLRNPNWKKPTWDDVRFARRLLDA